MAGQHTQPRHQLQVSPRTQVKNPPKMADQVVPSKMVEIARNMGPYCTWIF